MSRTDRNNLPPNINIRNYLKPGDIGYLTYLHGVLYAEEHGWDYTFEAYVAGPLAEFAKARNDRERIWIVEKDANIAGSIAMATPAPKPAETGNWQDACRRSNQFLQRKRLFLGLAVDG